MRPLLVGTPGWGRPARLRIAAPRIPAAGPLVRSSSVTPGPPSTSPVREGLFTEGDDPHLLGAICSTCGNQHFPRTDSCPYCGADTVEPRALPSTGRLWAWTTVTAAPPGYGGPVPFGFGVVELDGCVRVITRLTEPDADALQAGQSMHLVVDQVGEDEQGAITSWAFAPDAP
jgi:uncharacterized protein